MEKKVIKIKHNKYIFCLITEIIIAFILGGLLSIYLGPVLGFGIVVVISLFNYFPLKKIWKKKELLFDFKNILLGFFGSIGISFIMWYLIENLLNPSFDSISFLLIIFLFLFSLPLFVLIHSYFEKKYEKYNKSLLSDRYIFFLPYVFLFLFIFFIQPCDIYLNNYDEIPISLWDSFISMIYYFPVFLLFLFLLVCLPTFIVKIITAIFSSFIVCSYIQLLFFNKYIGLLIGGNYIWRDHKTYSLINLSICLFIILVAVIFLCFSKTNKIYIYLNIAIIFILFTSLSYLFIVSPKESIISRSEKDFYYFDSTEQFTVGNDENVIFLIADAVDNSFVKTILNDDPSFFDELSDFTLYSNTCSVYDWTSYSVPQMLYGYTQKKGTEKTIPFMSRFSNNGYRFLFYCHSVLDAPGNPEQFISNYKYLEDASSVMYINKKNVRECYLRIVFYQILPCILKNSAEINKVNFDICLEFPKDDKYIYKIANIEFDQSLALSYNEYSSKCFIYQHIEGAHYPCDDCVNESKYCLSIFKKYIYQLKELGVYDNSVIIIASDHGIHDGVEGYPYPTASTPMFLIKGKNEKHDKIVISNKPFYFQDIQATVLKYSGLYNSEDYELFGKTIDDFSEDEIRKRVWFDSDIGKDTRKYTYSGDTTELERVVNENIYESVDNVEFDFKDLL
ncbi:hypothetical protein SAMN04487760_101146 [Lachnospiraceae bacterium G41]|nr:hypothetical protein SAMN04487760_101146 [Lachnospiraceae bacterium G41]